MLRLRQVLLLAAGLAGAARAGQPGLTLVMVTDAHGWYSGHRHNESFDADYGSLVSMVQHLKASRDRVLLVENGDVVDGGALTDAPPYVRRGQALFSVLNDVGFDARTLGNHELYDPRVVSGLGLSAQKSAFVSSNVVYASSREPVAQPYKRVILAFNDEGEEQHALVVGFIYEMKDADSTFSVLRVASVIYSDWFTSEVKYASLVIVLAHMGSGNALIRDILSAIRTLRGPDFPVIFVAGHTHVRARVKLDACALAVEAGRYSDTVGVVEMYAPCTLDATLVDATRKAVLGFAGATNDTEQGLAIRARIQAARRAVGADRVVGKLLRTLPLMPINAPNGLWHWFLNDVAPATLLSSRRVKCGPALLVTNAGVLRYDLLQGDVSVDDLYAVVPFHDELRVQRCVDSKVVAQALSKLSVLESSSRFRLGSSSGAYLWTAFDPAKQASVDVIADVFDAARVFALVNRDAKGQAYERELSFHSAMESYFSKRHSSFS